MAKPMRISHPLLKIANNALVDLPAPSNISAWWNFGSLLGLCLMIQIATGLFLAMHYTANVDLAFSSVAHICRDVNYGWLLRTLHANGASFFFICLYLHVGRGMYYGSYNYMHTWSTGVVILFLVMGTAFMGYVLPWGQMSFWGATVITNLLSAVPYLGIDLVQWVWGGFAVDNATLTRFFTFHFVLPFIVAMMVMIHLLFLHQTGSNNPLGLNSNSDKIPFHPYFTFKDIFGFIIMVAILLLLTLLEPYMLGDPDNFTPANPLVTPVHIQPEWYFLFAYAICWLYLICCDYDMIVLTESFLGQDITDSEFCDDRYVVFSNDSDLILSGKASGGGVLVAVKKGYKCMLCSNYNDQRCESMTLYIQGHTRKLFMNVVYITPSSNLSVYEGYFNYVENMDGLMTSDFLIVGDFNMPEVINASYNFNDGSMTSRRLFQFMSYLGLTSSNNIQNCNFSTLDLVLGNIQVELKHDEFTLVPEDLHHPALHLVLPPIKKVPLPQSINREYYNFKKANFLQLYCNMRDFDWSLLYSFKNIDLAVDFFYTSLYSCFENCVPKQSVIQKSSYPVWFTRDIIQSMKMKKKCAMKSKFSKYYDKSFSQIRSELKMKLHVAYAVYIHSLENGVSNNISQFWTYVKSKRESRSGNNSFLLNDNCYTPGNIADGFAEYFSSVYVSTDFTYDVENLPLNEVPVLPSVDMLNIAHMTADEVSTVINKKLKPKKSSGPDGIPPYMIKGCADMLVAQLTFIFNLSLKTSCFPEKWKMAKITPILKGGNLEMMANYRPVSVINAMAKVFEHMLYFKIYDHIKVELSECQHGFMPGSSVITNLLGFTQKIYNALDTNSSTDVMYMDLEKAFDKGDHKILLTKLHQFGVSKPLLQLLTSYLKNSQQSVCFSSEISHSFVSSSGVPQGPILGLFYFLLWLMICLECFITLIVCCLLTT